MASWPLLAATIPPSPPLQDCTVAEGAKPPSNISSQPISCLPCLFKNYTSEEIYEQRKKKFLSIGRQKSFITFSKDDVSLVGKSGFITLFKENYFKYKNKLIIVFLLLLAMGLILI